MRQVTITRPAKHGLCLDIENGGDRTHVRVFRFAEGNLPPPDEEKTAELPLQSNVEDAFTVLCLARSILMQVGEKDIQVGQSITIELPQ